MKKFLGFNPQQYGDLYMCTVAARCLKRVVPDSHLTFIIASDYRECAPIFLDHPDIDRVHILSRSKDGLDEIDWKWIKDQKFDHIFNPMQDHDHSDPWWKKRHQALETAYMHRLPIDADDGKISLTRWFKPEVGLEKYVAISPWAAFYAGTTNPKAIPMHMIQRVVDWLIGNGWSVLQIGGPNEPVIEGAKQLSTDYFTSLRYVLGCRAMIMGDSGFNWLLSGYDFPVLGLYSEYYFGKDFIHNIQPINKNGVYLTGKTVADIGVEQVLESLKVML